MGIPWGPAFGYFFPQDFSLGLLHIAHRGEGMADSRACPGSVRKSVQSLFRICPESCQKLAGCRRTHTRKTRISQRRAYRGVMKNICHDGKKVDLVPLLTTRQMVVFGERCCIEIWRLRGAIWRPCDPEVRKWTASASRSRPRSAISVRSCVWGRCSKLLRDMRRLTKSRSPRKNGCEARAPSGRV